MTTTARMVTFLEKIHNNYCIYINKNVQYIILI